MKMVRNIMILVLLSGILSAGLWGQDTAVKAEEVRIASYNVENMMYYFDQIQMPERMRELPELYKDQEDLYELVRTIKLERCNPDILLLVECVRQDLLEKFNQEWLGGMYEYVHVFPGNTDGQFVAVMARKGFKPLEVKEQYYLEVDKTPARENVPGRLFSRGPGYVRFETPGGNQFWVGVTHTKSKSGNNSYVTQWRIRELERTRAICGEIAGGGSTGRLLMMGDFNDSPGLDEYEAKLNVDAIAIMEQGREQEKLVSLTRPYIEKNPDMASYHCLIKPVKYRSFLDHAFASESLAKYETGIWLVDDPIAAVASDHYPLVTVFKLPAPETLAGK